MVSKTKKLDEAKEVFFDDLRDPTELLAEALERKRRRKEKEEDDEQ
jgi:hypothetical protein